MLIGSTRHLPISLHPSPGGVDKLSLSDLITGQIPFTLSGLGVLHGCYCFAVTDRFTLHHIPSIWQRSFSIASAVASSSCGSSSPAGTESGLGRSDRQLSEEHSSAAPCCCLYKWCSTRNCSSGTEARREDEKGAIKAKVGRMGGAGSVGKCWENEDERGRKVVRDEGSQWESSTCQRWSNPALI